MFHFYIRIRQHRILSSLKSGILLLCMFVCTCVFGWLDSVILCFAGFSVNYKIINHFSFLIFTGTSWPTHFWWCTVCYSCSLFYFCLLTWKNFIYSPGFNCQLFAGDFKVNNSNQISFKIQTNDTQHFWKFLPRHAKITCKSNLAF